MDSQCADDVRLEKSTYTIRAINGAPKRGVWGVYISKHTHAIAQAKLLSKSINLPSEPAQN